MDCRCWISLAALTALATGVTVSGFAAMAARSETSKLVFAGGDGRLRYTPAAPNGDTIPDFSNAGYMGGGVKLPDAAVKVTVEPVDSRAADRGFAGRHVEDSTGDRSVAKMPADKDGVRGAVLLKRGKYRIEGQLKITAGGVVLRGEGEGEDGTVLDRRGNQAARSDRDQGPESPG